MLKTLIASGVVGIASVLALPAHAAPVYFNPEVNVGADKDGVGSATAEFHLGVKSQGAYAQIGPMLQVPDSGETEVGVSGKAGYGFGPGYTELSFSSMDSDTSVSLKVGGSFDL
nr:outer membrane protein A-like protein [uncultured Mediterranean phage uvMED]